MKAHPVLTTFHRVNVYTSHSQSSGATTTSVRHTYTVHCHDGRSFVFKPPLPGFRTSAKASKSRSRA